MNKQKTLETTQEQIEERLSAVLNRPIKLGLRKIGEPKISWFGNEGLCETYYVFSNHLSMVESEEKSM